MGLGKDHRSCSISVVLEGGEFPSLLFLSFISDKKINKREINRRKRNNF